MCAEPPQAAAAVAPQSPAASQPQDLWMVCRDGTRLATRLWRPTTTPPWPVLLMRQPYGRAIASSVTYAHPSWYARHGFMVAVQDVRGRGDSEGQFGGFAQEASDGADAVRWARRLSGSNGRVGSYGFSYQGLTQLLNDGGGEGGGGEGGGGEGGGGEGGADPETLPDCLAPVMCGLDERLHWASSGGCHWWALGLAWGLQLAAEGCRRRGDRQAWLAIRACLGSGRSAEEGLALLRRHDASSMVLAWLEADASEPGAAAAAAWRRHQPPAALLARPMLLVAGWWDPHLEGSLDLWSRSRLAGGKPALRVGPWTHLNWQGGIDRLQLAFFRRHLQPGLAAEPGPGPNSCELFDGGTQQWQQVDPCQASGGAWSLASDGLAARDSEEGVLIPLVTSRAPAAASPAGASVTLVHDPWRPVPGRGGHLGLDAGPCDRSDLDQRADVACFSSARLEQPLSLLGRPVLELSVSADQPSFDLCGALSLVEPSGQVLQLSTGVLRLPAGPCHQARPCRLVLQPLCHSLHAGQRLRLSLAAAAWPQVAVNGGGGELPQAGADPSHRVISLTLELDGSRMQLEPLVSAKLT